ncbi:MAG: secondary thiamine-phosphate synthase enzyme YjbQ [Candidatus Cloacimonetes bacterium]|nr:secondary thiamine-phosphate synthase enzyme YjbQ [Candidatus Cloacimonadota bacterium]
MQFKTISVSTRQRCQMLDVTREAEAFVRDCGIRDGRLTLFVPHTTAAVTINENADPDVVTDMLSGLAKLAPRDAGYRHAEGNSDAHIKSSLVGCSQNVLVQDGRLLLGTWQGIWFCEFDGPRTRKLVLGVASC